MRKKRLLEEEEEEKKEQKSHQEFKEAKRPNKRKDGSTPLTWKIGRKRVKIADDENVPDGWKVAHDKKVDHPNTHKTPKNNSEEETSNGQSQAQIITEDKKVP